ncbi:hypothetical protein EJB05_27689, partial [Eragrostis curvula]
MRARQGRGLSHHLPLLGLQRIEPSPAIAWRYVNRTKLIELKETSNHEDPNAFDLFKECHYSNKKKCYTSSIQLAIKRIFEAADADKNPSLLMRM